MHTVKRPPKTLYNKRIFLLQHFPLGSGSRACDHLINKLSNANKTNPNGKFIARLILNVWKLTIEIWNEKLLWLIQWVHARLWRLNYRYCLSHLHYPPCAGVGEFYSWKAHGKLGGINYSLGWVDTHYVTTISCKCPLNSQKIYPKLCMMMIIHKQKLKRKYFLKMKFDYFW